MGATIERCFIKDPISIKAIKAIFNKRGCVMNVYRLRSCFLVAFVIRAIEGITFTSTSIEE
ncbi:MAG: hypothetical protein DRJ66_05795 [Thermoprotei archaeon]|nr:MAG: hypothetical protein DRJ66_05795 [Thermoprotei archaeon]